MCFVVYTSRHTKYITHNVVFLYKRTPGYLYSVAPREALDPCRRGSAQGNVLTQHRKVVTLEAVTVITTTATKATAKAKPEPKKRARSAYAAAFESDDEESDNETEMRSNRNQTQVRLTISIPGNPSKLGKLGNPGNPVKPGKREITHSWADDAYWDSDEE